MERREKIEKIVINYVSEIGEEYENSELMSPKLNTELYGENGSIDSMSLVRLIGDLEESVNEEFNKEIVLADERALSQEQSPFRTVQSLVDYIELLINE